MFPFLNFFFTSMSGILMLKDGRASNQPVLWYVVKNQLFGPNFERFSLFYFSQRQIRFPTLCMTHIILYCQLLSTKEGFYFFFFFRYKKPLWSRLSPAFNDVKPCLLRVCKSVSLSKIRKKWCRFLGRVNISQHWGT